jgi:hypothetical protein
MTRKAYFGQIKSLADELSNAGQNMDDSEIISYTLDGLDDQYDGFVASITSFLKTTINITINELYSMFLPYEARLEGRLPGNNNGSLGGDISSNPAS